VHYNKGDVAGDLWFGTPGAASTAAVASPGPAVAGATPALSLLTGDAEVAYWTELWAKQDAKRAARKKRDRDGGGGGGGGGAGRGGGGRDRESTSGGGDAAAAAAAPVAAAVPA